MDIVAVAQGVLSREGEKFEEVGLARERIPQLKTPTRKILADTLPLRVLLPMRSGL